MASELLIPPGFAQMTIPLLHTGMAREAVITFGIEYSTEGATLQEICDFVFQQWFESLGATVDSEVLQGPARGRFGQAGDEPLAAEGTSSGNSVSTDQRPPAQVALLVRKSSNRGGRRGRGRFYIPWAVNEASVNELGAIEGTTLAAFQDAADAFLLALGTGTGEEGPTPMFLLHVQSTDQVTLPGTPSLVTALTCDSIVGTQRRRLGR